MYDQAILTVEKLHDENIVTFHVDKINVLNAKEIELLLLALLHVSEDNILLDLSNVIFIDSTGFTMLHKIKIESFIKKLEIKQINIHPDLQDLMDFINLN